MQWCERTGIGARKIAGKIRGLSPYPAEGFQALAEEVLPDVCIRNAESGEVIPYLCQDVMPLLDLTEDLMRRAMKYETAQDYIRECRRRAVAGKFVQVNGVLHPFSIFFQRPVQGARGEISSAYTVQQKMKSMIALENKDNPLSDSEIVDQLLQEGVDIARRTVAKYRGCLKIPTSYDRKRKYLSQRP